MQANFNAGENQPKTLGGFFGVSKERLKKISQNDLSLLMQSDWLELIYLHLHSLNHFSTLSKKAIELESVVEG